MDFMHKEITPREKEIISSWKILLNPHRDFFFKDFFFPHILLGF